MKAFHRTDNRGFTLIEAIVVIGLIGLLAAIAMPSYMAWVRDASYKEAAREVTSLIRDARSRAVQENWEFAADFDLSGNRYQILKGDRYSNSTTGTAVTDWTGLDAMVGLRGGIDSDNDGELDDEDCDVTSSGIIAFHADGSLYANTGGTDLDFVCIMNAAEDVEKFRVNILSEATGKTVIEKRP